MRRPRRPPADDAPGEGINDKRHVDEALPRGDVGEVCQPQQVQPRRPKLSIHSVGRTWHRLVGDCGPGLSATDRTTQAHLAHQARHRAASDGGAFTAELPPDLAHAVDAEIRVKDPSDLCSQRNIPSCPSRGPRINPPRRMGVVGRRGDRQNPADRLDPIRGAMIVDKRDHGFDRRPSSAWAKYADALRRISFAWRNSRISRSIAFMRSRSSLIRPGRRP